MEPASTRTYEQRRGQIEHYFDRTAVEAWSRLTTDAPVGRVRATVRAGRDQMRGTLMSWLPADLTGRRILDAGCGTGLLSIDAARRGAQVVAIDLSPKLVALAGERLPRDLGTGTVEFRVGDMFDPALGEFDHVVAMDSLIHYEAPDMVRVLAALAARARSSVLFTFAPRTAALAVMHALGQIFPRGNRSPAIEPVAEPALRERLAREPGMKDFLPQRTARVARGFYISQAMELQRR